MPVTLGEWRVRIGTFLRRQRKEYDYNFFLRKLLNLVKTTKNVKTQKGNTGPESSPPSESSKDANGSGPGASQHTSSSCNKSSSQHDLTADPGSSCDINSPKCDASLIPKPPPDISTPRVDNVTESGPAYDVQSSNKSAPHSSPSFADMSSSHLTNENSSVPDSTDIQNLVIQHCPEGEEKDHPQSSSFTQISNTDQNDVSKAHGNPDSPAVMTGQPSLDNTRQDKDETSESQCRKEDQLSSLPPESRHHTTNAQQTTSSIKGEMEVGSLNYPAVGSGQDDAVEGSYCQDMTRMLLMRSGDVELNPGPNDTSTSVSDDTLLDIAKRIPQEKLYDLGNNLGLDFSSLRRHRATNTIGGPANWNGTLDMLVDWRDNTPIKQQKELLKNVLISSSLHAVAEQYLPQVFPGIDNPDLIKAYEEALKSGKVRCNRSRIMVVGPAGIGKTSLIRRLTGQPFNHEEKSTIGTEYSTVKKNLVSGWKLDNDTNKDDLAECMALHKQLEEQEKPSKSSAAPSAEVQDISPNALKTAPNQHKALAQELTEERIISATSTANDISYSIWDFGGQVIYYITHPLFLSWRSLYIVVFPFHRDFNAEPPRAEEINIQGATPRTHRTILDLLHFWLMSIYVHAVPPRDRERFEPKILLVGTFRHKHGITEEDVKYKTSQIKKMVRGKPYAKQIHSEILQIDNSSSSEKEVAYIQEQIDKLVKESAYMQEDLPIRWRTFSDKMRALKRDTLLLNEARTAMTDVGIIQDIDSEVEAVLQFYHNIGDLVYHQGCDLIVLNPQFLNDFVSNIITVVDDEKLEGELGDDWKTLIEKGILTMTLLEAVWKSNNGKPDELKYLINMMVKFDLMCKIPKDPRFKNDILQGCHFVPCCTRPELCELQKLDKADMDDEFEFIIDFNKFLPDGFLHRLYVRMASWSMEKRKQGNIPYMPTFHCREMLFYIDELHRVVMTNTIKGDDAHRIKVLICRRKPKNAPEIRAKRISLKRDFLTDLKEILEELKNIWARRMSYSLGLPCTKCRDEGKRFSLVSLEAFLECEDSAHCGECDDAIHAGSVKEVFMPPSTEVHARATEDSSESRPVSEKEFLKLAQDIDPSYYTVVGVSLEIPYAHLNAILIEKLNNYPSAFMTIFMKWNVKQQSPNTNKRAVLADKLQENDLGDLSERLRNGRLLPYRTGTKSKHEGDDSAQSPHTSGTRQKRKRKKDSSEGPDRKKSKR